MTQEEKKAIVDKVVETAVATQIRDDVCSRSTMYGLQTQFDFIPDSFVKATASLCGGTGSGSGSCGAYCAGLLALVGVAYKVCYLVSFYYVMMDYEPSRAVLYTILAFLELQAIPLLLCRNNVPVGIAGRREPTQPKYGVHNPSQMG